MTGSGILKSGTLFVIIAPIIMSILNATTLRSIFVIARKSAIRKIYIPDIPVKVAIKAKMECLRLLDKITIAAEDIVKKIINQNIIDEIIQNSYDLPILKHLSNK